MNYSDYIVLAAVAVWLGLIIIKAGRRKKSGGACMGCCGNCSDCHSAQKNTELQ